MKRRRKGERKGGRMTNKKEEIKKTKRGKIRKKAEEREERKGKYQKSKMNRGRGV